MTIEQFTKHLNKTTSSIFSPTPPREPTPPRDLIPPRDESKGKRVTTKEPLKDFMPFMGKGGLDPKIPSFKSFVILKGKLTNEDVMAQVKEMKRLANLKAEKEKSEKSLQKTMNPATIRAQAQKMAEYEAKMKKMLDEYNHQISYMIDQLPITKISYKVNSFKEASMRIAIGNDPLNLTVYEKIILKTLGLVNGLNISERRRIHLATTVELIRLHGAIQRGLDECKATASNLRRIKFKDIVKEVKDHLKTYSSARMDISWYVEGIHCGSKKVRGGNNLTILLSFEEEQAELKLFSKLGLGGKLNKALRRDKRIAIVPSEEQAHVLMTEVKIEENISKTEDVGERVFFLFRKCIFL
nr:hypothetical protein [Tanacetum cinerariifolium]